MTESAGPPGKRGLESTLITVSSKYAQYYAVCNPRIRDVSLTVHVYLDLTTKHVSPAFVKNMTQLPLGQGLYRTTKLRIRCSKLVSRVPGVTFNGMELIEMNSEKVSFAPPLAREKGSDQPTRKPPMPTAASADCVCMY